MTILATMNMINLNNSSEQINTMLKSISNYNSDDDTL